MRALTNLFFSKYIVEAAYRIKFLAVFTVSYSNMGVWKLLEKCIEFVHLS